MAPETQFKSILKFRRAKSVLCMGKTTLVLSLYLHMKLTIIKLTLTLHACTFTIMANMAILSYMSFARVVCTLERVDKLMHVLYMCR